MLVIRWLIELKRLLNVKLAEINGLKSPTR